MGWLSEVVLRGSRLNRRMHNKAWIADNRVAIIGGRNIGDEYFGASPHSNFSDLDVAMAGPIVTDLSREFDAYWNSRNAVPVSRFDRRQPKYAELQAMVDRAQRYRDEVADTPYIAALRDVQTRGDADGRGGTRAAGQGRAPARRRPGENRREDPGASEVLNGLVEIIEAAQHEILIISPYFVPGQAGAESLVRDAQRGLRVAVLTNSLAATDVAAVHTGYARVRRELLKGGVELFEMKRKAASEPGRKQLSVTGSSGASLHTKAMLDRSALGLRRLHEPGSRARRT